MNLAETKNNSIMEDYKAFVTELVQKQMLVIGPNIALDKAKGVTGLSLDNRGTALGLSGDPYLIVKNLIDEYSLLSYSVTHSILCRLVDKYPTLKDDFSKAITKIELSCPIEL